MQISILLSIALGALAVATIWGLLAQQKAKEALNKLQELEGTLATEKTQKDRVSAAQVELEQRFANQQKLVYKLEKDLKGAMARETQGKKDLEDLALQHAEKIESQANQLEHYKSQAESLTEQLAELSQERVSYKKSLNAQHEEKTQKLVETEKSYKAELDNLSKQINQKNRLLQESQQKIDQLQKKPVETKEQNPFELKEVKQKIKHYQTLYNIARGQKEMAEERNENWELALRRLSSWILKEKKVQIENPKASLGATVAKALEVTKSGSLVLDGEDELSAKQLAISSVVAAEGMIAVE